MAQVLYTFTCVIFLYMEIKIGNYPKNCTFKLLVNRSITTNAYIMYKNTYFTLYFYLRGRHKRMCCLHLIR